MASLKGPGEPQRHDGKCVDFFPRYSPPGWLLILPGSKLRIGIVHARWNAPIITALVAGARKALSAAGVLEPNIVVQDVPGSYELPFAIQRCEALTGWFYRF